jgi:hypothetical protein
MKMPVNTRKGLVKEWADLKRTSTVAAVLRSCHETFLENRVAEAGGGRIVECALTVPDTKATDRVEVQRLHVGYAVAPPDK